MDSATKIKERVMNNHSLYFARVPKNTRERFIKIANDEFEGDYGMLLKFLMDGVVKEDIADLIVRMQELEQRIVRLENKPEEQKKGVTLLNGRRIGGIEK